MSDVLGMKQYLSGMSFTNVINLGPDEDDNMTFSAYCEDNEKNAIIQFDEQSGDAIYVYVKYEDDDVFNTFDKLVYE